MFPCAGPNTRHVLLSKRSREVWHNLVEMQMLEQLEPGRAEDMRVLQHLYGIPIAALDEQRQRCPRDGNQNGFLSGKKSVHDAVVGFIREAASEDPVDIPFHHRWHRQPPEIGRESG